jgi:mRNA interferase RelE/StbE
VTKVRVQQEVLDYVRRLAPGPKHAVRMAVKNLAHDRGDIRALTDDLEGFHRLRVGSHRIIFEYEVIRGRRVVTCVFAGQRKWVYEVFQGRLAE